MQSREEVLQSTINGIKRGDYFSLLGPRYCGKTPFLQKLIERLEKDEFIKCFYWEAHENIPISKSNSLYNQLRINIRKKLLSDLDNEAFLKMNSEAKTAIEDILRRKIHSANGFIDLIYKLLDNSNFRLVLILNKLHLLPKYVIRSILFCLREIYNSRESKILYKRLNVIISGISNLLEFTTGEQSPFNISHPLSLSHLTVEEARSKLITYSEYNIYCAAGTREFILAELNNHPYFINKIIPQLFQKIYENNHYVVTKEIIQKSFANFIDNEVLNLQDKYLSEVVKKIKDDVEIFETVLGLLDGKEIRFLEHNSGVSKYYLSGAIIQKDKKLAFTNTFVKEFLKKYFGDQMKGDYYLHFGMWEKAIEHYIRLKTMTEIPNTMMDVNRLEEAVNSVMSLVNKCFEEEKIWNYFLDTLFYIFQFSSVEIFEKLEGMKQPYIRMKRRFSQNGKRGRFVNITPDSENLIQYALESGDYVVSDNRKQIAYPINSWDGKKQWMIFAEDENADIDIQKSYHKTLDNFITIISSALDRVRSNFDIFEMLGEEVSIIDRDGNILYMNKARRNRFGKDFSKIKGSKCYEQFAGIKSNANLDKQGDIYYCFDCPSKEVFEESKKTGQTAWRQTDSPCREKVKNKEYYLLQTSVSLRDEYGRFTRALNISRDITKLQKSTDLINDIFQIQQREDLTELIQTVVNSLKKMEYSRIRFYEYYEATPEKNVLILKYHAGMRNKSSLKNFELNIEHLGLLKDIFQDRAEIIQYIDKKQFKKESWYWIDTLELDSVEVLFLPIHYYDLPFGLLAIDNKYSDNKIKEEDKRLISNLIRYIIGAIQNILFAKNQKTLFEITSELHNYNTLISLLPQISESILKHFNVRLCSIFLYNRYKNQLVCNSNKAFIGNKVIDVELEEMYSPSEAITGSIFSRKESKIINDLPRYSGEKRDDYIEQTQNIIKEKVKNCLIVPIISESETLGIIRICNKLDEKQHPSSIGFKFDEKKLLENIGKQVGLAVSKIQTAHGALWQRNIISSTLRTIQEIETQFLENFNLESYTEEDMSHLLDKVYFIILTGLTIKSPFGFNRAIIIKEENNELKCKCGIGPIDEKSRDILYNQTIWKDLMAEDNLKPYDEIFEKISRNYDEYNNFYNSIDKAENEEAIFRSAEFNKSVVDLKIKKDDEIWQIYNQSKLKPNYHKCINNAEYKSNKNMLLRTIKAFNWLILPLVIDNKSQGLIFVDNRYNERPIARADIESLEEFLDRISITLGKLEALRNQIKQSRSHSSLFRIMKAMTEKKSLAETIEITESELRELIPSISCICLLHKDNNEFHPISSCMNKFKAECKYCERADRACLENDHEYYCKNRDSDPCFQYSKANFISRFLIKLNYDGEYLGILDVDSLQPHAFSDDDLQILRSVAKQFSVELMEIKVGQERENIFKERENMLKDKEQAFSEIAHEMKTPLIGVKDLSLNVADFEMEKEELNQNLILIANEANKALNFTNQILDLAFLEHGKKTLEFKNHSIDSIIQKSIERNKLYAETKNIAIEYSSNGSNQKLTAEVNEENLVKAFSNIINNAIKYSKENSRVIISISSDADNIYFTVKDFGYGIPGNDLDHIFEKHHRGEYAKNHLIEGIGIGLTIADLVVKKHLGIISVTSNVNQGSLFKIQIPKQRIKANEHEIAIS